MIEPKIRGSSYFRQPVPANEKFAVTLRYLATGKQQSLPCTFQVFLILRMYVSMNEDRLHASYMAIDNICDVAHFL